MDAAGPTSAPASFRWRAFFIDKLALLFAVATLIRLSAVVASWHWGLDVMTSFLPQQMLAAGAFGIVFAFLRAPRWAVAAALSAAVQLAAYPDLRDRAEIPAEVGTPLKVVVANVLKTNCDKDAFVRFADTERPDLLIVLEVDRDWAAAIDRLATPFAGKVVVTRDDAFGYAILSRHPIIRSEVLGPDDELAWLEQEDRFALLDIDVPGAGPIRIIAAHPLPPVGDAKWRARNALLARVAGVAAESELPVVVAGDFNVAPWSPFFRDLLAAGRLRASRAVLPPWRTAWSWPVPVPLLSTPIDHILHAPDIATRVFRVGPDIGSDHYPVIAEMMLPRRDGQTP